LAQLYFRYGVVEAGKSFDTHKVHYSYSKRGKKVLLFVPDEAGEVVSTRFMGLELEANIINHDIVSVVWSEQPECVIVDEAQFLTKDDVLRLTLIADEYNIPVICYGLLTDFKAELFDGAKALIEYADKLEEIKSVCAYCNKKARFNMRTLNGKPVFEGEVISKDKSQYVPVCRKCYRKACQHGRVKNFEQ